MKRLFQGNILGYSNPSSRSFSGNGIVSSTINFFSCPERLRFHSRYGPSYLRMSPGWHFNTLQSWLNTGNEGSCFLLKSLYSPAGLISVSLLRSSRFLMPRFVISLLITSKLSSIWHGWGGFRFRNLVIVTAVVGLDVTSALSSGIVFPRGKCGENRLHAGANLLGWDVRIFSMSTCTLSLAHLVHHVLSTDSTW